MRRLRRTSGLRRLVREPFIEPGSLVWPLFVDENIDSPKPVASMPGVQRHTLASLVDAVGPAVDAGIGGVLLFGLPASKDHEGTSAWDPDGVVPRSVRALRTAFPNLVIATDVCLCEYTDHGHCGLLDSVGNVENDPTVERLVRVARAHADAGADIVAPSDMMDARVGAIRRGLDNSGSTQTAVLSYAVKYASAFYGPFRDAADSAPAFGDRRGYQMDPGRGVREARAEALLDIAEGADMVMVKPAMAYLDIISAVRHVCDVPVAAYMVSGEYAMVKAAAANGWIDERRVVLEMVRGVHRAGADILLTYHAPDIAQWCQAGNI